MTEDTRDDEKIDCDYFRISQEIADAIEDISEDNSNENLTTILLLAMRTSIRLLAVLPMPETGDEAEKYDSPLADYLIEAIMATVSDFFPTVSINTGKVDSKEAHDLLKKIAKGEPDADEKLH